MSETTISAIAAVASSAAALVAVFIAAVAERRGREAERRGAELLREAERRGAELLTTEVYLALRTGFLEIFEQLGDLDEPVASTLGETRARQAYWHHAYDEWLIGRRLAPHALPELWDHFKEKIRSGAAHPALAQTLTELMEDSTAGFGAFANEFVEDVGLSVGRPLPGSEP